MSKYIVLICPTFRVQEGVDRQEIADLIDKHLGDYGVALEPGEHGSYVLEFEGEVGEHGFIDGATRLLGDLGPLVEAPFALTIREDSMSDDRDCVLYCGDADAVARYRKVEHLRAACGHLESIGVEATEAIGEVRYALRLMGVEPAVGPPIARWVLAMMEHPQGEGDAIDVSMAIEAPESWASLDGLVLKAQDRLPREYLLATDVMLEQAGAMSAGRYKALGAIAEDIGVALAAGQDEIPGFYEKHAQVHQLLDAAPWTLDCDTGEVVPAEHKFVARPQERAGG